MSCVTACGNFGLVGSQAGDVVLFNMQSGIKRKSFKVPHAGINDVRGRHVTGVSVDALNRVVVVSTLKGALHVRPSPSLSLSLSSLSSHVLTFFEILQFFDFQTMRLLSTLTLKASVTSILLQRDNGLLAVVCDDLVVRIVDIETRRVVRELVGPRGRILDIVRRARSPPSRRRRGPA